MSFSKLVIALIALIAFIGSGCAPRHNRELRHGNVHPDQHVGTRKNTVATVHNKVREAQEENDKKLEEIIETLDDAAGKDSAGRTIQIFLGQMQIQEIGKNVTFDTTKNTVRYQAKAMVKGKAATVDLFGFVDVAGVAELYPLNVDQNDPKFRGHLVCISPTDEAGKYSCDRFYVDLYAQTKDGKIYKEQESYPKLNTDAANGVVKPKDSGALGEDSIPDESEDEAVEGNELEIEHEGDDVPFDPHDFQGFPPRVVNELFEKTTPPEWLVKKSEEKKSEEKKSEEKKSEDKKSDKKTDKASKDESSKNVATKPSAPTKPSTPQASKPTEKPAAPAKPSAPSETKSGTPAKPTTPVATKPAEKPAQPQSKPAVSAPSPAIPKANAAPVPTATVDLNANQPDVNPAKSPAASSGLSGGAPKKTNPPPAAPPVATTPPPAAPTTEKPKEEVVIQSGSGEATPAKPETKVDLKVSLTIAGVSQAIGYPASGKLENASKLDLESDAYIVKRPEQKQYFGTKLLIEYLRQMGLFVLKMLPGYKILIGDLTDQNGGPQRLNGKMEHQSHQNGLDADLNYLTLGHAPGISLVGKKGAFLKSKLHINDNWSLFKEMANSNLVSRIFVNRSVKIGFCKHAKAVGDFASNKKALKQLVPEDGHDMHFHLRLRCPADSPRCLKEGPIVSGGRDKDSGCD